MLKTCLVLVAPDLLVLGFPSVELVLKLPHRHTERLAQFHDLDAAYAFSCDGHAVYKEWLAIVVGNDYLVDEATERQFEQDDRSRPPLDLSNYPEPWFALLVLA